MKTVTLQEILEARDRRAQAQKLLLEQDHRPVLSFTMNIPGPVKDSPLIRRGFDKGLRLIEEGLRKREIEFSSCLVTRAVTGNEFLCTVGASPETVKEICMRIEDSSPMGRLFDMDVIGLDGKKLTRTEERRCLVCGAVGRGCASRRLHSLEELDRAVSKLLRSGLLAADAERVDELATKALLDELDTTPKPGLVDRINSGSHRDMTPETLEKSAGALRDYWRECFLTGSETAERPPSESFSKLRKLGMEAEKTMFSATGGINTHKGAIFTLGTVCGALGRLWSPDQPVYDPGRIAETCAELCFKAVEDDFSQMKKNGSARTAGERFYLQNGMRGIRGQLVSGLPAVTETALPVLEACLNQGMSRNNAGAVTLLHLISLGEDTNMVKRGGPALAGEMSSLVREELQKNRYPSMERIRELDELFIRHGLSPGGCADLLAVSYFLYDWKLENNRTE